ncbi:conserved hypothetical protein [Acetitomaculum ruminis DSM 5522]|uniref:Purine nucleoside phosphorylase n=1 Tax=Acetitomaculum ruminis DSM 5522 TaxID=1120918 RepID=A0A1I0VPI8_9FIRM|nr:peptidoglycan editing factor PgeF [Acetitomaculum ruminis]SFA77893.1 conserved hypothetical protein [Acetitomaculum ruminis DSM 5522]
MKLIRNDIYNKKGMILDESGKVPLLKFNNLENTGRVKHGFTTRLGGVSENEFSTLNLSFTRGDKKESVYENFKRVADTFGMHEGDIVCSKQTHTDNIRIVTVGDKGKGVTKELDYDDVDGLICNQKGILLAGFFADCVPVFLFDPEKNCIGIIHSGWRGTVKKIGKKAVEIMEKEFYCNKDNIIAGIGPSICKECYEVSHDLYDEFSKVYSEKILNKLFEKKENGKYLLDLWLANKYNLLESGLLEENIEITDICTCQNKDILFSHRATGGKRGNLGAFISLA